MRRWRFVIVLVAVVLLVAFGVHRVFEKRAQRKREAAYQQQLKRYSEILKTGMTRQHVEDYLSRKNIFFRQMCCVKVKRSSSGAYDHAYDDLVMIGQEDIPWVCRENNVYVAFEFRGSGQQTLSNADPSDTLTDLTIYHWLGGCL